MPNDDQTEKIMILSYVNMALIYERLNKLELALSVYNAV